MLKTKEVRSNEKKQVSREGAKGAEEKQTIGRGLTQIKHR
jgi:hypothetical protein